MVRTHGAHDSIHYAENYAPRADALYATGNAWRWSLPEAESRRLADLYGRICSARCMDREIPPEPYASIALIEDGRMVLMYRDVWFIEAGGTHREPRHMLEARL